MSWKIKYTTAANSDLSALDSSQRKQVLAAIKKVSENPLPKNEGRMGSPLGNKHGSNLTGYCKIKILKLGLRVFYEVVRIDNVMKIIVIAIPSDDEIYRLASNRTEK